MESVGIFSGLSGPLTDSFLGPLVLQDKEDAETSADEGCELALCKAYVYAERLTWCCKACVVGCWKADLAGCWKACLVLQGMSGLYRLCKQATVEGAGLATRWTACAVS